MQKFYQKYILYHKAKWHNIKSYRRGKEIVFFGSSHSKYPAAKFLVNQES